MPIGDFHGLIEDWRKGRKRGVWRDTFDADRKEYKRFVATAASQFLPRIREFVTTEHTTRKAALKDWKLLVAELEEDMRMLDAFDPTGKTFITGSRDASLKIWDYETGKLIRELKGSWNYINHISINPAGSFQDMLYQRLPVLFHVLSLLLYYLG